MPKSSSSFGAAGFSHIRLCEEAVEGVTDGCSPHGQRWGICLVDKEQLHSMQLKIVAGPHYKRSTTAVSSIVEDVTSEYCEMIRTYHKDYETSEDQSGR